jgi:hypothetical protein
MAKELSPEERDDVIAILEKHVNALQEHFDQVQIFVSKNEPEREATMTAHRGGGNWYARYGQVKEWAIRQDEIFRIGARNSESEPEI